MTTTTKRPETAEEKEARIFNHYKQDLIKTAQQWGAVRYIGIEYYCSFPGIDPVKMGAALLLDGYKIEFDDSTITARENAQKRRRVERAAGLYSTKEA